MAQTETQKPAIAMFNPTQPFVHDWSWSERIAGERRIWIELGKRGKGKDKMRWVYQRGKKTNQGTIWSKPTVDEWHDFVLVYKPEDDVFGLDFFDVSSTVEEMEAFKAKWFERLDEKQKKLWRHVEFCCLLKNGQPATISLLC